MAVAKIPTELEPYRIGISFTMNAEGDGEYMIQTMQNTGGRPKQESWGFATPTCPHLRCRWANLARAAAEWADLAIPSQGLRVVHSEQLGLSYPRP